MIFSARGISASKALPSPFLNTFGTGQPMFMSMISKSFRYSLSHASRRMAGSLPNSCAAVCGSLPSLYKSWRVASLLYFNPLALTISVKHSPAPKK